MSSFVILEFVSDKVRLLTGDVRSRRIIKIVLTIKMCFFLKYLLLRECINVFDLRILLGLIPLFFFLSVLICIEEWQITLMTKS